MTHIAIQEVLNGKPVDWMEQVSDARYSAPVRAVGVNPSARAISSVQPTAAQRAQPTAAQRAIGDIAPKVVELTDNVLFGDVWKRPELSKRDRSLATVGALIVLNHPNQLRSHLALARQNGVMQEELIETITHLAFYAGWPNAVTAISVAKKVFEQK
ncbi:carboxymuconolactone decarboxylase family protein [Leptolyngbya sp. FACHB-321]|uniref:carboxymuconolactone decarboxylase family protein n=1 Tax=Leptolyngbya sp. FACHB-321 TaxID=2692807 RepID=UPI001F5510F0|nr:carboxymuconolactone decarboxylase family protein [Leptolyngbya sp. FACHB-321]